MKCTIDNEGWVIGFYEDNHPNIPIDAFDITDSEHIELFENQWTRKVIDGIITIVPERTYPITPEQQADMDATASIEADPILSVLKDMTPDEAYNKVMQATPDQLQHYLALLAKLLVWKLNR